MYKKTYSTVFEKFPYDPYKNPDATQDITVVAGSWRDMGRQYVQQCREGFLAQSVDLLAVYIEFLGSVEAAYEMAQRYIKAAKKNFPSLSNY